MMTFSCYVLLFLTLVFGLFAFAGGAIGGFAKAMAAVLLILLALNYFAAQTAEE